MSEKVPAAVVLATRGDLVLSVARPSVGLWARCLPGGKWDPADGETYHWSMVGDCCAMRDIVPHLARTAAREFREEVGIDLDPEHVRPLCSYVGTGGRSMSAFLLDQMIADMMPREFKATADGLPAWVPPTLLLADCMPFREECRIVFNAAGIGGTRSAIGL